MTARLKISSLFLFLIWAPAISAASCPSLVTSDAQEACDEFETIYGSYALALSKHYGRAMALATHLNYPLGEDRMGKFPVIYIGTGFGAALTNTDAIKSESDPEVTSSAIPSVMPAPTFSLNLGVGITEKFDLRLSVLPLVKISIPESTPSVTGSVTLGTAKLKAGYNLLAGKKTFSPGITLSGFTTWNQGKIEVTSDELTTENRTSAAGTSVVNTFTYTAGSTAKWLFFGAGGEIRVWYNLLFFYPYAGYGFGFQGGRFRTTVTLAGDITVTPTATGVPENSTVSTGPDRSKVLPAVLQRIFFGFEFQVFAVRLATEVQFAFGSQLAAVSIGAGMQF